MDKKNKWILVVLIILTILILGGCVYSVLKNSESRNEDALKFKNEYAELNGKYIENMGVSYITVNISDTNTVKYVTENEVADLLESESGVIYFGFSSCPWCRSLVSTLTKVAEEKEETIYYLDILDIRSTFEIEDSKLNKIKDGTEGYYKILELLDSKLEPFILEDDAGNKYDTNEKRLYAPTIVAFNNGKVTDIHVGTVESQASGFDELTEAQVNELEGIIERVIDSKNNEVCTSGDKC